MSDILLKMLIGFDRRRNPAAGLFYSAASDFRRSLGSLGHSLANLCGEIVSAACDSPSTPSPSSASSYAPHATSKPRSVALASGGSVDVSGGPVRSSTATLNYEMQIPQVPDFAKNLRSAVDKQCEKYNAQKNAINSMKAEIDSCERIDLEKLDREIMELQVEIDRCQSSASDFLRRRQEYRAEGMLLNVFVHGIAQRSLAKQIAQLHERAASLTAKQDGLRKMIDRRNAFDFEAAKGAVESMKGKLETILRDYWREKNRLDGIDRQMKHFMGPLSDTTNCLNLEIDKYNALSQYAARLDAIPSAASDAAYRRRLVHQECEAEFGDGRVGQLRSRVLTRIRKLAGRYDNLVRQAKNHARAIGLQ